MRALSSLDAQFLVAERGNFGSQYCGVIVLRNEGAPVTAATMSRRLAERVHRCQPLRWKVVDVPLALGYPVFMNVDVDLAQHVTESTLPAPADIDVLRAEVAVIHARRLARDIPMWRVHVFHGLPGMTAVVVTVHHSAADGIAATEILGALVDSTPPIEAEASASPTDIVPGRRDLVVAGLAQQWRQLCTGIGRLPDTLANLDQIPPLRGLPGVHDIARLVRGDRRARRVDAPRTRFNARLSPTRSLAVGSVSLGDVKDVKNRLGFTVNDVVIALCAGALRRRLAASGELPAEPLVAYVPVSTRRPGASDRFGNEITSIIAPIPTHLDRPDDRLRFARDALAAAKRRTESARPSLLSDVNDAIPAPIFGIAARALVTAMSSKYSRPPVNLIISNVAGPPATLTCLGNPLVANYPLSVIFDGFALNITVVSYRDSLDIGIVADAAAMPDTAELIVDIRAELDELTAAIPGSVKS